MDKRTPDLAPGDLLTDGDVVTSVELPTAPAVVAIVRVMRNGKAGWFGSGIEAVHDVLPPAPEGVRPEHWALSDRDASLGVGHVWTNTRCAAYRTLNPADCTCVADWKAAEAKAKQ